MSNATKITLHSDVDSLHYGHRLLSLYRILLALLLFGLFFADFNIIIGFISPKLFLGSVGFYIVFGLISLYLVSRKRFLFPYFAQCVLIIDLFLFLIFLNTSGGLSSNLATMSLVIIASAALLVNGRFCFFVAALSIFGIFLQEFIGNAFGLFTPGYTQGITFTLAIIGTAGIAILINQRASQSEQLAAQRSVDLKNLTTLNEYILEQMQSGVLVIDDNQTIILHNAAAQKMFGVAQRFVGMRLNTLSEQLHIRLLLWQQDHEKPARIQEPNSGLELQPIFLEIGGSNAGTLIFIEDSSAYTAEFQSLKQASLGRMAGSIAHEIRNPLSAIQHAAQLLSEDKNITDENERMLAIIIKQSIRMNRIVENVMQLSKKEQVIKESINIAVWFDVLLQEFMEYNALRDDQVRVNITPDSFVLMDSSQLHQIVWNILTNSYKYGLNAQGECEIFIDGYQVQGVTVLELADNGAGIPEHLRSKMFEPFFSGGANSAGLGLYIVRELCDFNRIKIEYFSDASGKQQKPYFKLIF